MQVRGVEQNVETQKNTYASPQLKKIYAAPLLTKHGFVGSLTLQSGSVMPPNCYDGNQNNNPPAMCAPAVPGTQPPPPKQDQLVQPIPKEEQPAPKQEQPVPKEEQPQPKQQEQPQPKQQEQPSPKEEQPSPKEERPSPKEERPQQQEQPPPEEEQPKEQAQ